MLAHPFLCTFLTSQVVRYYAVGDTEGVEVFLGYRCLVQGELDDRDSPLSLGQARIAQASSRSWFPGPSEVQSLGSTIRFFPPGDYGYLLQDSKAFADRSYDPADHVASQVNLFSGCEVLCSW